MCEYSGKLIAWMDGELDPQDAAAVQAHLDICAECRGSVDAYRRASDELNAYFREIPASDAREWSLRTVALASAAGALSAALGLLLLWPRVHTRPQEFYVAHAPESRAAGPTTFAQNTMPASPQLLEKVRRRSASIPENGPARHRHERPSSVPADVAAYSLPDEAVVEIAIPADDMFPPGAVPAGMNFVADMTIAADGSAARLQVRPRLAGFERSTRQP
jgi:hypothetical protein